MNYQATIPWYKLRARLETLQREVDSKLRRAVGEEIYRLQGKGELIEQLMNLPETLQSLDDAEKDSKENEGPKATRD